MSRVATERAVKVAMLRAGRKRTWHLVDKRDEVYCGVNAAGLAGMLDFPSLAAAEPEAESARDPVNLPAGPYVCRTCIDNRRMRGDA